MRALTGKRRGVDLFLSLNAVVLPALVKILASLTFVPNTRTTLLCLLTFIAILRITFTFTVCSLPVKGMGLTLSLRSRIRSTGRGDIRVRDTGALSVDLDHTVNSKGTVTRFVLSDAAHTPSNLSRSAGTSYSGITSFVRRSL